MLKSDNIYGIIRHCMLRSKVTPKSVNSDFLRENETFRVIFTDCATSFCSLQDVQKYHM